MNAASSLARNANTPEMSEGVPSRDIGMSVSRYICMNAASSISSASGVRQYPGATALTRTA